MVKTSKDLIEIIGSTIDSIKDALTSRECGVVGPIEFEIAVIKTKAAKGGFKFLIADASGNYGKESVSKITFKVMSTRDAFNTGVAGIWLTDKEY